jgi:predicted nuclease of predicted toxin-antitoxin system
MKLKLDENMSARCAQILRTANHDVSTVREQNLEGESDRTIFDVCQQEARALVSLDRGIGQLQRFSAAESPGVVILELGTPANHDALLSRVRQLIVLLENHDLAGSLWIIEPHRVRMHRQAESG